MKTYQLDSNETDKLFLGGESIQCPAVLPVADMPKPGERLVILLSNGKKYMGEIRDFDHTISGGHAQGKLRIIRYPKQ
jgi:hypothetical protein